MLPANFERYLRDHLPKAPSIHPDYEQALAAMLLAGGKRFRPQLLFAVVDALRPALLENSFPAAYAIECLHTYSLIHDDLPAMDDADLRRGSPTLHKRYDEVTAILAGDALNTHSFLLLAEAPLDERVRVALVRELAYNGGAAGMVLGQAVDCRFENTPLPTEEVEKMHVRKTGMLIAASLKMGAIIAGADEGLQRRIYDLGIDLGLLFQINDDIIDAVQSEEEAGKTTGNDGEKNSFVTLIGLEATRQKRDALAEKVKREMEGLPEKLKANLSGMVEKYLQA